MESNIVERTILQVQELLEENDLAGAIKLIESLRPADQADVFEELDPNQQAELMPQLDTENAADILQDMEEDEAAGLATLMEPQRLAQIIDEMEPDEAADLLGDLEPSVSTAALAQMAEAEEIRPLLLHPDETAGGLMTSEYLAFPEGMHISNVLTAIREWSPRAPETYHLFVVDRENRLVGIAGVLDIIRASPHERVGAIMQTEVLKVHPADDQETAARLMARYDLAAVPVVDDEEHLIGVITVDDLVDVLEDEATEDIQRIGGAVPLDRPYLDNSIANSAWKRVGWLLLLFVTGTLTGSVIGLFEGLLEQVTILAVFVPLLIGTGGNAGAQTTATIIRALSVGDIQTKDALVVLWREFRVSVILGLILATVALGRAFLWEGAQQVAVAVSASIFAIVLWANMVGATLPILAAKLKVDPALVSGPLMSTLVDATGLLIYFSIARLLLS